MLGQPDYNIADLFSQLGLANDEASIEKFIKEHKLDNSERLIDAKFWTDKQRAFLREEWERDAVWIEVIDELNALLHDPDIS
ncbi:DUF2789 domain-containing protein [Neisseria montereyensis]|uniref:DUF2789 domain-containing protein n=1 Tax=Neisseria montereyensis TaxID=2973938 RepID=A0ABT2FBS8_9NEIS|nr:DUF2789 domain-containing protein [Neisseria montereyensis]MCS4533649.1 DUF2789 domain-containing protein [Neisseria montereyensis]